MDINKQNVKKRIMISAPRSGCGKTYITILLIRALMKKGYVVCSAKCGPDYIDTMYHRKVLGIETLNLDSFFVDNNEGLNSLLDASINRANADICIMEGAMGFYDGLGGVSVKASTYEISDRCDSPVILVVDAKGSSVTMAAVVNGIKSYKVNNIEGIILNRCSVSFYDRLKELIEKECGLRVLGYMPELKNMTMPSRHLGLLSPEEIDGFECWINEALEQFEKSVNVDEIFDIAREPDIFREEKYIDEEFIFDNKNQIVNKYRIAIARDEAFSFYYNENEEFLKKRGADIVYFSPIHDEKLPENIDGLILGGGYPEIYAKELSGNIHMREDIKAKLELHLPFIAECGGFLYLQQDIVDINNNRYDMVGFFEGKGFPKGRLVRFGYTTLQFKEKGCLGKAGTEIRCHEFHHWDCTDNGEAAIAQKQYGRDYECMKYSEYYAAGFPHFYFEANPAAFDVWIKKCLEHKEKRNKGERKL